MAKRIFDIVSSLLVLIILSPAILLIMVIIKLSDNGTIIFKQKRVGKNGKEFNLFKFRTMVPDADKFGLLTVGMNDTRITKVGAVLRRYKLDEIPQLINIIKGDMSVVGPRPEVKKYVSMYNAEQRKVLLVKPGLTDLASINYINENEVLEKYNDPEKAYIEFIMPHKIELNLEYIKHQSLWNDFKIIMNTILKIVSA